MNIKITKMKNLNRDFVSIIIPCREINNDTKKCITECLKQSQSYKEFEIIVLPDNKEKSPFKIKKNKVKINLKIIPTGRGTKPSVKRNLGMRKANSKTTVYAFIDSDAYPEKDWLKNAMQHIQISEVGMVGGPNLTPNEASRDEKLSGYILENFIASGNASIRYKKAKEQFVKELPSCNFIVKKQYATEFPSNLLTAEDTKFCYNILAKNKKILYSPDIVVYHHRREFLEKHTNQMWIYGRDIAFLVKKAINSKKEDNNKEGSNKKIIKSIPYFSLLSILSIYLSLGILSDIFSSGSNGFFNFTLFVYLIAIFMTSLRKSLKITSKIFIGIIATHFAYGFGFIYGLFKKHG